MFINNTGLSLELHYIDGNPEGMLTAEVFNWTGHVLKTPRIQISEALNRPEAKYTGVYLLLGESDGESCAYIGESESIGDRIKSHDNNKDWWTDAILITSTANNLNKAHIKYLESRLVEEANFAGRIPLQNGNQPNKPSLSESSKSNMETFLQYIFMVLPALKIDIFAQKLNTKKFSNENTNIENGTKFELNSKKYGIKATAQQIQNEFIVLKGSSARETWVAKDISSSYAKLHKELIKTGVLITQGTKRIFSTDYAFKSPSAAAAVISGRASNGRTAWKVENQNITYHKWDEIRLSTYS
jgi:hypothetical protein